MQRERAAEEELARHLRIRIATLLSPQRIEKLATERLGMVPPSQSDVVIVQRLKPADLPGPSEVARR
jgi:cell division protein FtsL